MASLITLDGLIFSVTLTEQEQATVLAALKLYQRLGGPCKLNQSIYDVATNGGRLTPLAADQIDALCEKIDAD